MSGALSEPPMLSRPNDFRVLCDKLLKANWVLPLLLGVALSACHPAAPKTPTPPDPVVFEKPKPKKTRVPPKERRDAEHQAALLQMLGSSFGHRSDKDHQARFPLPDRKNWQRVRFSMIDHFTGFIYGKDEHSLALAVLVPLAPDDPSTSAACVQRFEEKARTQVNEMGGRLSETATVMRKWHRKPLMVRTATGEVDVLFKHYNAVLAWTGYPAYDRHCMIYAVVVPWRDDLELAIKLRDLWVEEFKRFKPLTETVPFRHE